MTFKLLKGSVHVSEWEPCHFRSSPPDGLEISESKQQEIRANKGLVTSSQAALWGTSSSSVVFLTESMKKQSFFSKPWLVGCVFVGFVRETNIEVHLHVHWHKIQVQKSESETRLLPSRFTFTRNVSWCIHEHSQRRYIVRKGTQKVQYDVTKYS